ncbi:MAG: S1 family peptidase [Polyangiaceae bacterium]
MKRRYELRALQLGVLGLAVACSSAAPSPGEPCPGVVQSPLLGGSTAETYLGLSTAQTNAIVQVVDSSMWRADAAIPNGGLCSGTFVAPGWVLTAQHCLAISNLAVVVGAVDPAGPILVPVLAVAANPDEDIALLQVDLTATGGTPGAIEPLVPGGDSVAKLTFGTVVEIAGYGRTETNTEGTLEFLEEPLVGIDTSTLTVDGFGASGACAGDSGGPLLIRASDGAAVVAGVLSIGDSTCLETDQYVRVDAVQAWVTGIVGPIGTPSADCGSISEVGRCLFGSAFWCASGALMADVCSAPNECGWDAGQHAFRCVAATTDPCAGIDSVGACRSNVAEQCVDGGLVRNACTCGTCRTDGVTGAPFCSSVATDQ